MRFPAVGPLKKRGNQLEMSRAQECSMRKPTEEHSRHNILEAPRKH